MIRHAPAVMTAMTVLFGAGTWLARATQQPEPIPAAWAVITTLAAITTIALAIITPGSSDE